MFSTIEDTYLANLDTDKVGVKEKVIIYDTQGLVGRGFATWMFIKCRVFQPHIQFTQLVSES